MYGDKAQSLPNVISITQLSHG